MFGDRALEHGDVKIIKNAIDTSAFRYNELIRSRKRAELHLGDRFIVGHVGRMDKQKNPLFLIDIFEAIKKQENNASLLYIGIGPMENEVKKYASSKGLDDAIMFLGMRNDVNELLQAMDVFLLPSLYEGLGIVLIEAQASGLPCITTDGKVPVEANICGLVNYLSLDKPAIYWADQLMALRDYERQDRFESIKIAGYDIKTEVEKIEKLIF
jgi:glycosyltransferase involved in cell wall biosynthesis